MFETDPFQIASLLIVGPCMADASEVEHVSAFLAATVLDPTLLLGEALLTGEVQTGWGLQLFGQVVCIFS